MEVSRSAENGLPLTIEKAAASDYDARFVLSAASADRVRDTIEPSAYKPNLGKRLPALWGHGADRLPIGYWENLKVQAGKLIGDIKFFSIPFAQLVKTIIAEGAPLGASIGFRGKGEPNDLGGVHFTELDLLETSLVNVPAHPLAYQIAKQLGFSLDTAGQLPARGAPASSSLSAVAARSSQRSPHVTTKTISELVVATQQEQVALVDKLTIESGKLGEAAAGTDEFTTQKAIVDGIDAELQAVDGKLASLKSAEARLGQSAKPVNEEAKSSNIIQFRDKSKDTEHLFGKLALCIYESRVKNMPVDSVAAQRFPNSQAVETLVKAAQNPAMTNVPGYAQELTRQAYGALMEQLRAEAILPKCIPAGQSHTFENGSPIVIPKRMGTPTDAAAAFRAEGAPIPVKGLQFGSTSLTPKNMGVILTATEEMLRRSSVDLAQYFENAMKEDTAYALDLLFISNTAGTATAPAGARAGLVAGDTRASSGATAAAITTDVKKMMSAMTAAHFGGSNTKWIMHPSNLVALSLMLNATGTTQFPEAAQGRFAGFPVVTSTSVPADIVMLIDFSQFSFAMGTPLFLATNVATLHEENTNPLPIGTAGTPAVVAAPVRSLYQTYSWALRMVMDADWVKMRTPGPVQELTAVAW